MPLSGPFPGSPPSNLNQIPIPWGEGLGGSAGNLISFPQVLTLTLVYIQPQKEAAPRGGDGTGFHPAASPKMAGCKSLSLAHLLDKISPGANEESGGLE